MAEVGERYTQSGSWGQAVLVAMGSVKSTGSRSIGRPLGLTKPGTQASATSAGWATTACNESGVAPAPTAFTTRPMASSTRATSTGRTWAHTVNDDGTVFCHDGWTNCDGRHLHAVCPNGCHWDIDSRASNCGLPGDTEHRCWIRSGEPPNVNVDKNGRTCSAGAGSIVCSDYHGFLTAGAFSVG